MYFYLFLSFFFSRGPFRKQPLGDWKPPLKILLFIIIINIISIIISSIIVKNRGTIARTRHIKNYLKKRSLARYKIKNFQAFGCQTTAFDG